jgi:hypothetical protein
MEHISAIGGLQNLQNHHSLSIEGTIQFMGDNIPHTFLEIRVRPNYLYRRLTIHDKGVFERGFDGTQSWSLTPLTGPMLGSKQQDDLVERESDFDGLLNHQRWYPELIDMNEQIFAERPCHALRTRNHLNNIEILYFDREHHWLIGREVFLKGSDAPVWIRYGQYIEIDNIFLPIMKEEITEDRHTISMSHTLRWDTTTEAPEVPEMIRRLNVSGDQ